MPDPTLATISATEISMALGISPYGTPFTLWQRFKGHDIDRAGDARMTWGTKMEPLIIEQARDDLSLEVIPNAGDDGKQVYFRRGPIGATRDATIVDPDRGPGAFDAKCIFDYGTWMQKWGGGKAPPRHIELQLQAQMFCGDGKEPFQHGRIAAWVCGEITYFDREPIPKVWDQMEKTASQWFEDLKTDKQPDPFGDPMEQPWLALLDRPKGSAIDLTGDVDLAEKVRLYAWQQKQITGGQKAAATLKAQILAAIGPHESADFYGGISCKIQKRELKAITIERKASTSVSIKSYIPDDLPDEITESAEAGDLGG